MCLYWVLEIFTVRSRGLAILQCLGSRRDYRIYEEDSALLSIRTHTCNTHTVFCSGVPVSRRRWRVSRLAVSWQTLDVAPAFSLSAHRQRDGFTAKQKERKKTKTSGLFPCFSFFSSQSAGFPSPPSPSHHTERASAKQKGAPP